MKKLVLTFEVAFAIVLLYHFFLMLFLKPIFALHLWVRPCSGQYGLRFRFYSSAFCYIYIFGTPL